MKIIFALMLTLLLSTAQVFAAEAPATPNQVTIKDYMFSPGKLTVAVGTKVTWVNHDDVPHTIVDAGSTKIFRSAALDTNDHYSYAFAKPGTYHYFCTLHPQMVGTIIVQ